MAVDKTIVNLIWKRKIGERGREIGENHRENGGSLGKIGESRWENGGNGFYFGERRRENGGSGREIGEHDPRIGGDASAMGKIARKKGAGLKAVPMQAKISGEPRIHVSGGIHFERTRHFSAPFRCPSGLTVCKRARGL
jgi:hypothetical protein